MFGLSLGLKDKCFGLGFGLKAQVLAMILLYVPCFDLVLCGVFNISGECQRQQRQDGWY